MESKTELQAQLWIARLQKLLIVPPEHMAGIIEWVGDWPLVIALRDGDPVHMTVARESEDTDGLKDVCAALRADAILVALRGNVAYLDEESVEPALIVTAELYTKVHLEVMSLKGELLVSHTEAWDNDEHHLPLGTLLYHPEDTKNVSKH